MKKRNLFFLFIICFVFCENVSAKGSFNCTYTVNPSWDPMFKTQENNTCTITFSLEEGSNEMTYSTTVCEPPWTGIGAMRVKPVGIDKNAFLNDEKNAYTCNPLYFSENQTMVCVAMGIQSVPKRLKVCNQDTGYIKIEGVGSGTAIGSIINSKTCSYTINGLSVTVTVSKEGNNYDITSTGTGSSMKVNLSSAYEQALRDYLDTISAQENQDVPEAERAKCPTTPSCCVTGFSSTTCYMGEDSQANCQQADTESDGEGTGDNYNGVSSVNLPPIGFGNNTYSCTDLLGPGLTNVVKVAVTAFMIGGVIIAIVNGMIFLLPAVIGKDPDALKKAGSKCVKLAVLLALILLLKPIISIIGRLFGFDLSCFL